MFLSVDLNPTGILLTIKYKIMRTVIFFMLVNLFSMVRLFAIDIFSYPSDNICHWKGSGFSISAFSFGRDQNKIDTVKMTITSTTCPSRTMLLTNIIINADSFLINDMPFSFGTLTLQGQFKNNNTTANGYYILKDLECGVWSIGKWNASPDNCSSTIINESSNNSIKVFPNPFNDDVFIEGNDLNILSIDIYNSVGSLILSKNKNLSPNSGIHINLAECPKGLYYLRIHSDNFLFIEKLIKY
jgi:hypothetical protein